MTRGGNDEKPERRFSARVGQEQRHEIIVMFLTTSGRHDAGRLLQGDKTSWKGSCGFRKVFTRLCQAYIFKDLHLGYGRGTKSRISKKLERMRKILNDEPSLMHHPPTEYA
ncbi:hypothetical protein BYT27DRAFT_7206799 [Phlegmacium glaucopus]|nr:hypothetical protein BYT27DRAFT_7206799 [Phlegmacium glaucopus]